MKFPATPTVNAPGLVMRFGSPPAGLLPDCWMKICGSITDALAGDDKRASAPSAAAPERTEIDLGFGMFATFPATNVG